jgi:hypothetical protein
VVHGVGEFFEGAFEREWLPTFAASVSVTPRGTVTVGCAATPADDVSKHAEHSWTP